ncbi:heavy metal translocating P-type ATPase [Clostridium botulinum]|uniref:Cd(2+)-exporting ATPase n=2 Tax=Clostridium botulinum TaxID=1491 RepID=A0A9Q1UXS0_CLOBO|nr:heavy metal translocating P-type ATPase [Clostridium botulinum]AEB76293.1 cation-transporting ATPase [Clostridium botulinum BKT015925]KEH99997.1 ATPase P [Clostridium botulinum D str. 16868]KEI04261.1 ATPase P [Clostridium botulinum C/D str. Sp77]KLU75797.1 ATPase P [Clostridium botulinum V891]KOA75005.1 ATPase P [Clostridium botulinum]
MILRKKTPLLRCDVLHSIPGRIRIGCRALLYLGDYKLKIYERIKRVKYIKDIKINILTKNILIYYDISEIEQQEVIEIVEGCLSEYSLFAYKAEREDIAKELQYERGHKEEAVSSIVKRLAITSGTLMYSLIRKNKSTLNPTNSMYKKFTSVPAITSLYLTLPLFKSGIGCLFKNLRPNADTLTVTSIVTSLLLGKDSSALTITLLSDIAELLTSYTMEKTRDSIKNMLELNEEYVWKQLNDQKVEKVKIEKVQKGDLVVIHTGEKICIDGKIVSGEAVVEEAAVTGEFMPAIKREGSHVFAGTVVKNGTITVATEKVGDDTVVSRIIHLVEDAACKKAPIQDYADKFSSYLVPFNFLFAGVTYWVTKSPTRALNMLVIDYSCGIKLSTATAFSAAINTSVKNGVLIKGGNYIEALASSDTLILDKTGTLTEGKPQIVSVVPVNDEITKQYLIEMAGAAEETSKHPMAIAVLSKLRKEGFTVPPHGEVITHISRGIETQVEDNIVRVGSKIFMKENNIDTDKICSKEEVLLSKGESIIYIAVNENLIGILGIQDKMRFNMKKSLNNLRYQGVNDIMLLTGDLKEQAEIVANKVGVDGYEAELLPEDKAKTVLKLQSRGSKVVMVGDGINDAPALAYADVGIALGGGTTDAAMEASDITIQSDEPMLIPSVKNLSKNTMKIVKQNFGLVVSINSLGLLLSAAGVLPVFWGAVLHNSSTIFVVSNSLRLLFYDMERGK